MPECEKCQQEFSTWLGLARHRAEHQRPMEQWHIERGKLNTLRFAVVERGFVMAAFVSLIDAREYADSYDNNPHVILVELV